MNENLERGDKIVESKEDKEKREAEEVAARKKKAVEDLKAKFSKGLLLKAK